MTYTIRHGLKGLVLAGLTIALLYPFPDDLAFGILAVLLGAITGIYIGVALTVADRNLILVETVLAVLFLLLAVAGWKVSPLLLALGYFLHGLWDLAHHPRYIRSPGPAWYQPACLAFDWSIGVYIVARELGTKF